MGELSKDCHLSPLNGYLWSNGFWDDLFVSSGGEGRTNASMPIIHPHLQELPTKVRMVWRCQAGEDSKDLFLHGGDCSVRIEMEKQEEAGAKFPRIAKDASGRAPKVRRVALQGIRRGSKQCPSQQPMPAAAVNNPGVLAVLLWGRIRNCWKVPGTSSPAEKPDTRELPPATGHPDCADAKILRATSSLLL